MTDADKRYDSGCPVAYAMGIFGDRWSLLIIRDMALKGVQTYGQLQDGWEGISTNILANRLKALEQAGMLTKRRDPDNGRSFVYELTQKARDLAPVISEIILWSGKYNTADHAMTDTVEKVRQNKAEFERDFKTGRSA